MSESVCVLMCVHVGMCMCTCMCMSVHECVCRCGVHLGVCFCMCMYSFSNGILWRLKLDGYLDICGTIEEIVLNVIIYKIFLGYI